MAQRPRNRWDMPPEDMARSLQRDKERFLSNLMVDPSAWTIAKKLAPRMGHHGDEGLRGIYQPATQGPGNLYWWIASGTSHHQGRLMMGLGADAEILEVEVNMGEDGTLYLCWSRFNDREDLVDLFLKHPTMMTIEGCLAVRGRQVQLKDRRVRLLDEPAKAGDVLPDPAEVLRPAWTGLLEEARLWTKSRRATLANGKPKPPMTSIRPYRAFLQHHLGWHAGTPLPEIGIDEQGAICAIWRKGGRSICLRFHDDHVHPSVNTGPVRTYAARRWRRERDVSMYDLFSYEHHI